MKAVFDVKPGSGYDDDITRRYHFPGTSAYLDTARQALGDWIVYREPQRNRGRRAYVAVARLVGLAPDPDQAGHFYAYVKDYLEFATPVPFVADGRYVEAHLNLIADRNRVGAVVQGKSIRPISAEDFGQIVAMGLAGALASAEANPVGIDPTAAVEADEPFDRRVEKILLNRKVRDANFRLEVCRAYDNRCAVTGLKIVDHTGCAEVQAAHIRPVALGGPDVIHNGIALSATIHWLFDRHLISIDEDYRLLVAEDLVPDQLGVLFRTGSESLHLTRDRRLWPRPAFLAHHRGAYVAARRSPCQRICK